MTNLFISDAYAQAAAAPAQGGIMGMFLPMLVVFAIFYFLIIRPQKKRDKDHQSFVSSLQKGDEVVTQSGLLGKITGVADKVITLEVAQNVKIKVLRGTVVQKVDQNLSASSPTN
jgi:preprotein translocase subunit YajC